MLDHTGSQKRLDEVNTVYLVKVNIVNTVPLPHSPGLLNIMHMFSLFRSVFCVFRHKESLWCIIHIREIKKINPSYAFTGVCKFCFVKLKFVLSNKP